MSNNRVATKDSISNNDDSTLSTNHQLVIKVPLASSVTHSVTDISITDLIREGKSEKIIKQALQNKPSHAIDNEQSALWIHSILSYRKPQVFSFKESIGNTWKKRHHLLDYFVCHGVRLNVSDIDGQRSPFAHLIASSSHTDFKSEDFINIIDLFICEGCAFIDDANSAPVKHLLTKLHAHYINHRNQFDSHHAKQSVDKYFLKIVSKIEYLSPHYLVRIFNDLRRDPVFCSSAALAILKEKTATSHTKGAPISLEEYFSAGETAQRTIAQSSH